MTAARRYHALLTTPGVPRVVLAGLIGRLPTGMAMLLFVLVVHAGTGSYAVAGYAAALNCAVVALTGPPLGRLADRGHAALVLTATGLAQTGLLVALVLTLRAGLSVPLILGLAAVTGAVNPPIGAVTRTLLPRLARDDAVRLTAFAVDAVTVELTYVLGPAVVGVVSVLWDGYAATLVAAGLTALGALLLATAPALRHGYPVAADSPPAGRDWLGPLRSAGVRTVLLVTALEASAYGVLEVAIPAYANARGVPGAGGILFAVWSAGSIVGGLWFGGRTFTAPLGRQYQILMTLNVIGFGAMALASGLYSLGGLLFLAGLVISPTTAVESALVTALSPVAATTEALTWSNTAIYLGFAGGSALAAVALSSSLGTVQALGSAALVATGLVVAGAALLLVRGRALAAA